MDVFFLGVCSGWVEGEPKGERGPLNKHTHMSPLNLPHTEIHSDLVQQATFETARGHNYRGPCQQPWCLNVLRVIAWLPALQASAGLWTLHSVLEKTAFPTTNDKVFTWCSDSSHPLVPASHSRAETNQLAGSQYETWLNRLAM